MFSKNFFSYKTDSRAKTYVKLGDMTEEGIAQKLAASDVEIVISALSWISKNQKNYRCRGKRAKRAMYCIKRLNSLGNIIGVKEKEIALREFFACFANNVWSFENDFEEKNKTSITSEKINCYFVEFKGTSGAAYNVPLGALCDFVSVEELDYITKEYIQKSYDAFSDLCEKLILTVTGQKIPAVPGKELLSAGGRIACVSTAVLMSYIIIKGLGFFWEYVSPFFLDYKGFSAVFRRSQNVFQAICYYLGAENGFDVNCGLTLLILIAAVLSGIGCFVAIPILFARIKKGVNISRITKRRQLITMCINEIREYQDKGGFVDIRKKSANVFNLTAQPDRSFNKQFRNHFKEIHKKIAPVEAGKITLKRASIPVLVVLLCVSFGVEAKNVWMSEKFNQTVSELSVKIDTSKLAAEKPFKAAEDIPLYAKPDKESIVRYTIASGTVYTGAQDENPQNGFTKVKLLTQYGIMYGWVDDSALSEYEAAQEIEELRIPVAECTASSQLSHNIFYTPQKVIDGHMYTSWVDGVDSGAEGEYVELLFNKADEDASTRKVEYIGVAVGNCATQRYFDKNGRPVVFNIEFINGGAVTEQLTVRFEDLKKVQYLRLNRPVEAESVRFTVEEILPGNENSDAHISEIELYNAPYIVIE